jgi:hypothetical protein
MRSGFFLLFLMFLVSCGASKEEKVESAIDQALTFLSSDKCDEALDTLKDDQDLSNPIFLQVLASAYACKAGVSVVEVISDLKDFNSTNVLSEISQKRFAQSSQLTAYQSLTKSLDTILSSTQVVSQSERESAFGTRKGQDLGMQALIYSVVQVSKFVNYFGNADNGKKGEKGGMNNCFLNYSNNPIVSALIDDPSYPADNACQTNADGHPELILSTLQGKNYACHGMTLINNSLDILETIEFGDSQDLKVLKDISEKISLLRDAIIDIDPSLNRLFDVKDTDSCLDLAEEDVQIFIFAIYELGFK